MESLVCSDCESGYSSLCSPCWKAGLFWLSIRVQFLVLILLEGWSVLTVNQGTVPCVHPVGSLVFSDSESGYISLCSPCLVCFDWNQGTVPCVYPGGSTKIQRPKIPQGASVHRIVRINWILCFCAQICSQNRPKILQGASVHRFVVRVGRRFGRVLLIYHPNATTNGERDLLRALCADRHSGDGGGAVLSKTGNAVFGSISVFAEQTLRCLRSRSWQKKFFVSDIFSATNLALSRPPPVRPTFRENIVLYLVWGFIDT